MINDSYCLDLEKEKEGRRESSKLRLLAWEITKRCNLGCLHCRADAVDKIDPNELRTEEAKKILEEIALMGQPIVILTGGEPLLRKDVFELAHFGTSLGLRMVMAVNGTLIDTDKIGYKLKKSGIKRLSVSIDGFNAEAHDLFRGQVGAFKKTLLGIEILKKFQIEFQINTTVSDFNLSEIMNIHKLVVNLGAKSHHLFFLVPTGRGKNIAIDIAKKRKYEALLSWFAKNRKEIELEIKFTCAPQYNRILNQVNKGEDIRINSRGCLGGINFAFISSVGEVQPCGYLELSAGNIRKNSFEDIWNNSVLFKRLRSVDLLEGNCGSCGYNNVCGGCRARAYEYYGNEMMEDPLCNYTV